MNKWFKDGDEESEHREMIADPSTWPGDELALKRPQAIMEGDGWERSFARVHADAPLTVVTMSGNWVTYASAQELLDDGWVVD